MLDDLKQKLEALIQDLKARIPARFKKKQEMEEIDKTGEVEVDVGEITEVEEELNDSEEQDDGEEKEEEEDEATLARKKRSRIIKIVAIGAIVYFALDEFATKPPEDGGDKKQQVKQAKLKSQGKGNKKGAQEVVESEEPQKVAKEIEPEEPVKPVEPEEPQEPVKPIEPIEPKEPKEPQEPAKPAKPVEGIPPSRPVESQGAELTVNSTPSVLPEKSVTDESEEEIPLLIGEDQQQQANSQLGELVGEVKEESEEVQIKRTELSSPDYERVGQGLVYNCKGGHWACLNRINYFRCKQLQQWALENSQPPECVVSNVYLSVLDCQEWQEHNVNMYIIPEECQKQDELSTVRKQQEEIKRRSSENPH